ncbi:hypothetical protein MKW94_022460 [Papaver nudicaule]|uniref:N-acetyltransferase domain-containing protein n=1 Tax=Papaver nudicaule TaxID=74823 RepID=A0AA41VB25_PAPNU|nr:hypothetical protein [Papaver nudicaule]
MVDIRMATLADIPEIVACALGCFPSSDPVTTSSFFEKYLLSPLEIVYVAESGGHIVGHVVATMLTDELEEDEDEWREGHISWVGVHPTHRKLGIAAKLMTAAEKALVQEYGCEYVELHVRVSNLAAVNLYTNILGYSLLCTEDKYFNDGEDAYVMYKELPGT